MKKIIGLFVREALNDQRGQVLPWLAVVLVGMMSAAGLSIDVGRAYVLKSQLQNYANAGALAAAGEVYNSSSTAGFVSVANSYSAGASGDQNYSAAMGTVTTSVTGVCVQSLEPAGETCSTSSPANAVKVTQTSTIPTYFMALAGIKTLSVTTTAFASMQGVANQWNVAIIVDGTQSMGSTDSNCGGLTEFECALSGVQAFLAVTNPCASGASSCTPATANLRVALFAFPNLSTTGTNGFSDTSTCNGPFTNEPYTLPTTSATSYSPIQYTAGTGGTAETATYQMTDWDTGYYAPSSSSTYGLNSSDNLVETIGYGYNSSKGTMAHKGCLPNVGGESTYYGGVMYAAQAALLAEQKLYGGKNAMILLSDGQANADSSKFPSATSNTTSGISVTSGGTSSGNATTGYNLTGAADTYGLYPDYEDECQQAIEAAQSAAAAGTRVYAVAYGSEDSGCGSGGTDNYLISGIFKNVSVSSLSNLLPCVVMENVANPEKGNTASWQTYFYSDANQSGSGVDASCTNSTNTVTSLQDIFLAISSQFTTPRMLPANTSYTTVSSQ